MTEKFWVGYNLLHDEIIIETAAKSYAQATDNLYVLFGDEAYCEHTFKNILVECKEVDYV